ncbi:Der1-like family-domain-containing protein [Scheffersomyces amazonensis]|uniref:Der1-like family-domain-containing protein n=1 Tax=Scheffersomyces amazonensis TaxID=1078765 RepID=UPI00315D0E48
MPNQSSTLAESIKNIPPVTRFFTITTVIVCFANSLKIIQPQDLICYLPLLLDKLYQVNFIVHKGNYYQIVTSIIWLLFQSYRFFTAFLLPYGLFVDQPFQAILDIYFFYTFANHLESHQGKFRRNFPDCLWFTLLAGTCIVLTTLFYNAFIDPNHFPIHHQMMLSCVTYIWSRSSKNSVINFLGLIPIKAYYLPLFNLFFKLIVSGYPSFLDTSIGIFGGYIYQCIQSDTLPIYNLFPGAYGFNSNSNNPGRRVGTIHLLNTEGSSADFIEDSIFDKGYLKAPIWLYNLLNYPTNNSKRTTAFLEIGTRPNNNNNSRGIPVGGGGGATSTGVNGHNSNATRRINSLEDSPPAPTYTSWFGAEHAFQGKGHRLGD